MKHHLASSILLAIGISTLTACAGYDRILFVTKTNVGLDIDNKPPTAEITIARRELAITPTFQDAQGEEKTLPLLASFGLAGSFLDPQITSRFAGGEAALVLAYGPTWKADHDKLKTSGRANDQAKNEDEAFLCLGEQPDTRPLWKWLWHKITFKGDNHKYDQDTRAFYFATDTSFGLKAGWDGATGPYPDTVKLGYNRKELAFPPVFATPADATSGCLSTPSSPSKGLSNEADHKGQWKVTVPSFVASLDNSSILKEWFESGDTHIQFFATGKAASEFVKRPDVNAAMNQTMYRHNKLSIDPMLATVAVNGKQTFQASGGKGIVKFTVMRDSTGGATIEASSGVYTAGQNQGTSVVGAVDEVGKTAIVTVTVK
ncbi:MAG: hypothetical protein JSR31_11710 [Nitrospira sp.]|nr:hypothetical protein [Nitrospira sp.]